MPTPLSIDGLTVVAETPAAATRVPVLFVHGMFGGAWYFEKYQRFFAARGHPSWALNLRGHCGSRPVADLGAVSVNDYVADALEAVVALGRAAERHGAPGGRAPIVVGHSMGGLIAQKLAEAGLVSAAVLLCSAPPRWISPLAPLLARKMVAYSQPLLRSQPLAPTFEDNVALTLAKIPPEERPALHERFVPESGRAGREMAIGAIAVDASRVRCPVLSVGARDDAFVVSRVARALARKYDATLFEFPDHAHFILWEPGWERPADLIVRWLEQVAV